MTLRRRLDREGHRGREQSRDHDRPPHRRRGRPPLLAAHGPERRQHRRDPELHGGEGTGVMPRRVARQQHDLQGERDRREQHDGVALKHMEMVGEREERETQGSFPGIDGKEDRLGTRAGPRVRPASRPPAGALRLLDLDVQAAAAARALQGLLERWNPLAPEAGGEPGPRVQPAQIARREGGHAPVAVGGAVDREVVDDHRHAVGAQLDVELDGVGAEADRFTEGGEGVLRGAGRGAPVGDAQRPVRRGQRQDVVSATRGRCVVAHQETAVSLAARSTRLRSWADSRRLRSRTIFGVTSTSSSSPRNSMQSSSDMSR